MSQFLSNCTADAMLDAAAHLIAGDLVAFPTETVYGLGADATNSNAVARIYEVKGRPSDHPLIVHVSSLYGMSKWAREIPEYAIKLARDYWPGPITLILKRSTLAADFITGGQDTVGVRVPDHYIALALLKAFERAGGKGVAAPSANRFGHISPTTAQAVLDELGQKFSPGDIVLNGGNCEVGVESTIVDCTGTHPRVLRPGAISIKMIETSTGLRIDRGMQTEIRVSGSLEIHYSPSAKVLIDQLAKPGQGLIALEEIKTPPGVIRLASPKNDLEFAHVLYSAMRAADSKGLEELVISQPLGEGIATAVRDRISRAAGKGT